MVKSDIVKFYPIIWALKCYNLYVSINKILMTFCLVVSLDVMHLGCPSWQAYISAEEYVKRRFSPDLAAKWPQEKLICHNTAGRRLSYGRETWLLRPLANGLSVDVMTMAGKALIETTLRSYLSVRSDLLDCARKAQFCDAKVNFCCEFVASAYWSPIQKNLLPLTVLPWGI